MPNDICLSYQTLSDIGGALAPEALAANDGYGLTALNSGSFPWTADV